MKIHLNLFHAICRLLPDSPSTILEILLMLHRHELLLPKNPSLNRALLSRLL